MAQNIQLYNPNKKAYLSLVDGQSFSFQAENQKQDLDAYTCGYSFDIEVINDDIAIDALTTETYVTDEKETVHYDAVIDGAGNIIVPEMDLEYNKTAPNNVVLIVNGVPLYSGHLVLLETYPTTFKCSYQCFPYSGALKDFRAKSKLKDYFIECDTWYDVLGNLFQVQYGSDSGIQSRKVTGSGRASYTLNASNGKVLHIHVYNEGTVEHAKTGEEPRLHANSLPSFTDTLTESVLEYKWWASAKVSELLNCLGIECEDSDVEIFFPKTINYERLFKVRMYTDKTSLKRDTKWTPPVIHVTYKSKMTSPVWTWNASKREWSDVLQNGTPGADNYTPFRDTLRNSKSLNGMEIYRVEYNGFKYSNKTIMNPQLSTDRLDNNSLFKVYEGETYDEDGADFILKTDYVENTNISWDDNLADIPDYIDVIVKVSVNANDYSIRAKNSGGRWITNAWLSDVPYSFYDLEFLDMSIGDFLNQLSLCSDTFKWLRNPMYINDENHKKMYGLNYNTGIFGLGDDRVISMKKELSTDENSDLRIEANIGYNSSLTKHLNDYGNDTLTITPDIVGLAYTTYYKLPTGKQSDVGTLPIMVDPSKEVGTDLPFFDFDIKAVVGTKKKRMSDALGYYVWDFIEDSTDFDYVWDYSDKSDKYTFTVTGYQFQEELRFEGQLFEVLKYTTKDFIQWELECVKHTDWDGKNEPTKLMEHTTQS